MGETEQCPMLEITCLDCAKYTMGEFHFQFKVSIYILDV